MSNEALLLQVLEGNKFKEKVFVDSLGIEVEFRALSVSELTRIRHEASKQVKGFNKKRSAAETKQMLLTGQAEVEMSADEMEAYTNELHTLMLCESAGIGRETAERLPLTAFAEMVAHAHRINYLAETKEDDEVNEIEIEKFRSE